MEQLNTFNNQLNYRGQVSISIKDGKRTLTSSKHNSGQQPLFNFIANCLLGNFKSAKDSYPSKIACFSYNQTKEEYEKVSTFVHYDSAKYLTGIENGTAVNFHFRIPFTCLKSGSIIKKVVLYPNLISDETKTCAEVILDNTITVPEEGGNFTIIIDWKMSINEPTSSN